MQLAGRSSFERLSVLEKEKGSRALALRRETHWCAHVCWGDGCGQALQAWVSGSYTQGCSPRLCLTHTPMQEEAEQFTDGKLMASGILQDATLLEIVCYCGKSRFEVCHLVAIAINTGSFHFLFFFFPQSTNTFALEDTF